MALKANRRVTDGHVAVLGQQIRVKVRMGFGVPLVLCNGIGANLDVLDPLVAQLDRDTTVVRFDVPGAGGSPGSPVPYGFAYLAAVLGRLLSRLGLHGQVDVLGFSWGGALAQQFAFQNPVRCRRLILVATATGAVMVPGEPPGSGPRPPRGPFRRGVRRRRAGRSGGPQAAPLPETDD